MSSNSPYKVYLADVSYFSGKLETYLRYKEIPYERIEMNAQTGVEEVYKNTGMMKVPAVKTSNGLWLKDTTPMIDWFEDQHTEYPISPNDSAALFISKLIEDFADEGCWRTAMYFRWSDSSNARYLGQRIGKEVLSGWPLPTAITGGYFRIRQTRTFLYGDGLTKETEGVIRQQYFDLLESFDQLLKEQDFLLGDQPSLVDIAMMGPFYRHYFCDPEPAKIMRDQYPAVLAWVTRMWNAKGSDYAKDENPLAINKQTIDDYKKPGWEFILREIVSNYLPYLRRNASAWKAGDKQFDCEINGITLKKLPVIHYRVYCLEVLEKLYQSLDESSCSQVLELFKPYGDLGLGEGICKDLESGLYEEAQLPLSPRERPVSTLEKLSIMTLGTPWDIRYPFK